MARTYFLTTKEVSKKLTGNEIDEGIVAFIKDVGLGCGSSGAFNLYQLMRCYILDEERREEINEIIHRKPVKSI